MARQFPLTTNTRTSAVAGLALLATLAIPTAASAAITPSQQGETITLTGDDANDIIELGGSPDDKRVDVRDIEQGKVLFTIPKSAFTKLILDGAGGDDRLTFRPNDLVVRGKLTELRGGPGRDTLVGSTEPDVLVGGAGDDSIHGRQGDDIVEGGEGGDAFFWDLGEGSDTFNGGPGSDGFTARGTLNSETVAVVPPPVDPAGIRIRIANGFGQATNDTTGVEAVHLALAGSPDAALVAEGLPAGAVVDIDGGPGADKLTGSSGSEILRGGPDSDTLTGGGGDDRFDWRPGDGNEIADGGAGFDTVKLTGTPSRDVFAIAPAGGRIGVVVRGEGSVDATAVEQVAADALAGDDDVIGGSAAGALVQIDADGGDGNDNLSGTALADSLRGGNGDDVLNGFGGADELLGQAGVDSFLCPAPVASLDAAPNETVAPACTPVASTAGAQPPAGGQPQPSGPQQPQPQPPGELGLPAGFRGFAKPKVKASLTTLKVTVTNSHSAAITVKVAGSERDGGRRAVRFKPVTRTIAPGRRVTYKLATPKALQTVLKRALKRRGTTTRKPAITVTNVATSGRIQLKPKVALRRGR